MLYSINCTVEAERMLRYMERSTIYYLKQKGWTNVQIAEFTGHHRDTIARVLREEVDKKPKTRNRSSAVAVFDAQIAQWLDQNLPVTRMLELARADGEHPYTAGDTAFSKPELAGQTRYFFAARLKYSRFMFVSFHTDMREETLLRCLIACFQSIGGVPWVVVTDNMKTAVLGRNAQHETVWNPAYQKLAVEFTFHPEACAPASGNQKGAVENLVKYVKGNFIAGRSFHDDTDLAEQCTAWLRRVNTERPSDATGQEPVTRLVEEQAQFGALPATAQDYGFFDCVVVSREGLVAIETNRYSVPAHLIGRALTARVHTTRIDLFADHELVATHERSQQHHARIVNPAHFEAAFSTKPRARVMVYRDWLCELAPAVNVYVRELCHKRRAEMKEQMIALYELAQEVGNADFVAALELAAEQQMYGAEYVRAIVSMPAAATPSGTTESQMSALLPREPTQQDVERNLANYEQYVENREQLREPAGMQAGGDR